MNEYIAEIQAIRDTIHLYSDRFHTGDIAMMKKAFHPKEMMYGTSPAMLPLLK
jgi:hypothetical protein